jgi:hypothetical protein
VAFLDKPFVVLSLQLGHDSVYAAQMGPQGQLRPFRIPLPESGEYFAVIIKRCLRTGRQGQEPDSVRMRLVFPNAVPNQPQTETIAD